MIRPGKGTPRPGAGLNAKSPRVQRMARNAGALAAANARRVPCPICQLMVMPGALAAHHSIAHEED